MKDEDPYGDVKVYHFASLFNQKTGRASALCYAKPRAIPFGKETWTIRPEAVTCERCRELMPKEGTKR